MPRKERDKAQLRESMCLSFLCFDELHDWLKVSQNSQSIRDCLYPNQILCKQIEDIRLIASLTSVEINTLRDETVASRVSRLVDSSARNNDVA